MDVQLSNQQVAQVFRDIADSMEVLGENRFKYQAYTRAAEVIELCLPPTSQSMFGAARYAIFPASVRLSRPRSRSCTAPVAWAFASGCASRCRTAC